MAAQKLRHDVFHKARGHRPETSETGYDRDRFDDHCNHLIVLDEARREGAGLPPVIATYRLLDGRQAVAAGGFYSASEFAVEPLLARHRPLRFLEFGRSCVHPDYRDKRTVELLWHGSWAHVCREGHDVMFGCASFEGTDPTVHAAALSLLAHEAAAQADWQVEARGERVKLPLLAPESYDPRAARRALPPVVRGYLRLGAMFAGEAVIDRDFDTIDVLVLLPVARLNPRYVRYYGADAGRHAAAQ